MPGALGALLFAGAPLAGSAAEPADAQFAPLRIGGYTVGAATAQELSPLFSLLTAPAGGIGTTGAIADPAELMAAIDLTDAPAQGPADAPIVIVGYSDFACPWCAQAVPGLEALLRRYPDHVRWVYKHFPLGDDAPARLPRRAALAAAAQGRFWVLHHALLARNGMLTEVEIMETAGGWGWTWRACAPRSRRRNPRASPRTGRRVCASGWPARRPSSSTAGAWSAAARPAPWWPSWRPTSNGWG